MNPSLPKVILIDGTVGSGKSTVLEYLRVKHAKTLFVGSKLTTRSRRAGDNEWEFKFVESIPTNHNQFSFQSVGNQYAVNLTELEHTLKKGLIYVVSCVDKGLIHILKENFDTKLVYIYRPLTEHELNKILIQRNANNASDRELRLSENREVSSMYLDKITLYDHVLLNINDLKNLQQQIDAIIGKYI